MFSVACPARTKVQRCKQPEFERQALLAQNPMLVAAVFLLLIVLANFSLSNFIEHCCSDYKQNNAHNSSVQKVFVL